MVIDLRKDYDNMDEAIMTRFGSTDIIADRSEVMKAIEECESKILQQVGLYAFGIVSTSEQSNGKDF